MPGPTFKLGTCPFCSPDPDQCATTPGYQAVGTTSDCCWSGEKVKCEFNHEAWKTTATFSQLKNELGENIAENIIPQFTWFGSAPSCGAHPCDCFEAGMMPIMNDMLGDGSKCLTGEKWLCMTPLLTAHKTLVTTGMQQCYAADAAYHVTVDKALDFGTELVKDISAAIGKFGGGIPSIGLRAIPRKETEHFLRESKEGGNMKILLPVLLSIALVLILAKLFT